MSIVSLLILKHPSTTDRLLTGWINFVRKSKFDKVFRKVKIELGEYVEIIKCDKCKKVKKPPKGKSPPESGWISGNIRGGNPWKMVPFDFCEKCSKKLVKFIENYLSK